MRTLVVDFGGTVIKGGVVEEGKVVARQQIEGRSELGVDQALPRLAAMLRELGTSGAAGVGIALPTLCDGRSNRVLMTMKGKYDGLHERDLVGWCRSELGLLLRIENDAHAAILGEWRFGAGRGCDDLVMITLGTGIGTSVIVNGRALRGKHALAGNMGGHFVLDPNGFACVCGGRGCVEAQQHLHAVRSIAESDARWASSALSRAEKFDYRAIFALAPTDALADMLMRRTLDIWGALVTSLINQFDPSRFILGGGIMKSGRVILDHVQQHANRAATPWGATPCVGAELGDDAALYGLASLFESPPDYV